MGNDRCLFPVSPDSSADVTGEMDGDEHISADTPHDTAVLPGHQLLSPEEIQLCSSLKIPHHKYKDAKYSLLEMHFHKGNKKEEGLLASEESPLDAESLKHIFNFMVKSGWIRAV